MTIAQNIRNKYPAAQGFRKMNNVDFSFSDPEFACYWWYQGALYERVVLHNTKHGLFQSQLWRPVDEALDKGFGTLKQESEIKYGL